MTQEKRHSYIKNELNCKKKVEIKFLSEKLNVSEMTIRRDLEYLEKTGFLKRISKGAIINPLKNIDLVDDSLNIRTHQNIQEKNIIAKYASSLITDGDIICMDASTTVYSICPYILNKNNITIVTNSVKICTYFSTVKNINVMLTGGILRSGTLSLIGNDTINFFKQYNTNKLFMSGKALSYENGLTDVNMFEIETKKAAMENTKEIILLADHTKLNNTSLIKVCDINNLSKIIIDDITDFTHEQQELIDMIKKDNVDVILAH